MNKTILVSGGAGYIGSHAVRALRLAGRRVRVLDDLSQGHVDAVGDAEFLRGSLLDPSDLSKAFGPGDVAAVMHFAGKCYVGDSVREPAAYWRHNVVGTLNLLDAMAAAGVKRIVFSSSCAVYGPVGVPITEDMPHRPCNPYGRTKSVVEGMLADAALTGLSSVSLRYFNVAGCDPEGVLGERHEPETHLIPLVLREALRLRGGGRPEDTTLSVHGTDFPTPDGTCIRDYVHVCDIAAAHIAALRRMERTANVESGGTGRAEAFNIGTGRGWSVREVVECCRRATGQEIRTRSGPRRPGDPPSLTADPSKANRDLDWVPRHASLESMVLHAWRWMTRQTG